MMDKYNNNWSALSDASIVETIASFIKYHRLQQNKTQQQLAEAAGINRSTLSEFEKGNRSNVITLIQLLRALRLLDVLQVFKVQEQLSPIQLAELEQAKRKRASKTRKNREKQKHKSSW